MTAPTDRPSWVDDPAAWQDALDEVAEILGEKPERLRGVDALPPELLRALALPLQPPMLDGLEVVHDARRACRIVVWRGPSGRSWKLGEYSDLGATLRHPAGVLLEVLHAIRAGAVEPEAAPILAEYAERLAAWCAGQRARGLL